MKAQKELAFQLLDWHGGQGTGVYAVGSYMLSDANRKIRYYPGRHQGHAGEGGALSRAVEELEKLRERAKFPEAVSDHAVKECKKLAAKLRKLGGGL